MINYVADVVSPAVRSRMMAGIRGRNTLPERSLRKQLFAAGLRFRVQRKDLPGRPDIVLAKFGAVIFVHGCFWHRHPECRFTTTPKSNAQFWSEKFQRNVARDRRNELALRELGWKVAVVWECAVTSVGLIDEELSRLIAWLNDERLALEIGGRAAAGL